ncbi:hypothetical protein LZZ85_27155 [Terrimonas sp. NA20]|uniref:Uncharacterized protein n=1 Tax=Terrimonas ginsenosidimutans TaxID=2908004 RepID=A0ABS9L098_9BACT|nr:hypothetical protein [Terrimonas ginsenosidimutans]MCG2618011.1 hypothetical protein [Terrimonas ginsenosidimutans]
MGYFDSLIAFMQKLPGMGHSIAKGRTDSGLWWIKFQLDIDHPLSWRVVQELAFVVNYISVEERLPTAFYPVSPPPYLNGGAREFLSWVIESTTPDFTPNDLAQWLEGRLPAPVDDLTQWEEE